MSKATTADTARLFFAAWPAPKIRRELGELGGALQRECGGRAVPAHNVHLTLVFLGNVERERLPRVEALAAAATARRFELIVDRVEYWRHNHIVWAGVRHCPESLQELVAWLEQQFAAEGFRFDKRSYVPHVTLLRDARRAPAHDRCPAVAWPVTELALVESVQRERARLYEVRRAWRLGA